MWTNFWTKNTLNVILTSYNLFSSLRNPFLNHFPHFLLLQTSSSFHHKIFLLNSIYKFNMINYVSASVSQDIQECNDLEILRDLRYEEYEELPDVKDFDINPKISIKVMNYNVLSQQLLEQHSYLYRKCSPITLKWNFRFPRILRQIIEQNPDILCLQEVQENHIREFYNKLDDLGYESIFIKKTGLDKVDGCAIYFRRNMFQLVKESKVSFFRPAVPRLDRDNVGLVIKLRLKAAQDKLVVVANTHLLFNPRRVDVRLAQMRLLLSEICSLADENSIIFLTGDLNSKPDSPVVKLIAEGSVVDYFKPSIPPGVADIPPCCSGTKNPEDEICLKNADFNWQRMSPRSQEWSADRERHTPMVKSSPVTKTQPNTKDSGASSMDTTPTGYLSWRYRKPCAETVKPNVQENWRDNTGPSKEFDRVCHGFNFQSAYSFSAADNSEATTFQNDWIMVDYIFYSKSKGLSLQSRLRLPTAEECYKSIKELPNYASPSDHLPLVATFVLNIRDT